MDLMLSFVCIRFFPEPFQQKRNRVQFIMYVWITSMTFSYVILSYIIKHSGNMFLRLLEILHVSEESYIYNGSTTCVLNAVIDSILRVL